MKRPSRRLVIGMVALLAVIVGVFTLNIALGVKRAADDLGMMTLPTVQIEDDIVVLPDPDATAVPTVLPNPEPTTVAVPTATPDPEPTVMPVPDNAVNILLMGTDARIGQDVARTDAMIVVHIDPSTKRVSMLSLPRDLAMTIPRVNEQRRINTAYYLGETRLKKGLGPALAKESVGKLLGIEIDRYALISFDGFKELIDKLGGVTIDVQKEIYDPKFPVDAYEGDIRTMKVHFKLGVQKMDGETALIYSRTRHADSDFGRQSRQQDMLMAIFRTILDQGLYTQVTNLDDYTSSLRDHVRFDMSRDEILGLATLAPDIQLSSIEQFTIKPALLVEQTSPAYYLFVNDKKGFKSLINSFVNGEVAAAAKTTK